MQTLSKLSDKCKNCKYKNICDNKRMIACKLAEMQKVNITKPLMQPLAKSVIQAFCKKYTPVTINMGVYGTINTSMEEIADQINESFKIKNNFIKS